MYHKLGTKHLKHDTVGGISDSNNYIRFIRKVTRDSEREGSLGMGDFVVMSLTVQANRRASW